MARRASIQVGVREDIGLRAGSQEDPAASAAGHRRRRTAGTLMALGGVVGPAAFIAAWVIGGAVQDGYSPVDEPISRLAAVDASARAPMNVGLAALGVGLLLFAVALRSEVEGPAWVAAAVSGLATLGIVAAPLGLSAAGDGRHGALALTGYISLVAIPPLAARQFKRRGLTQLSLAVGIVAALCLLGSISSPSGTGAWQRAGLLVAHGWVIGIAVSLVDLGTRRSRLPGRGTSAVAWLQRAGRDSNPQPSDP